ncbi:putative enoyl-CoA hydratase echA8 [Rhodococcus sp. T7]|nr:putative enoyl-CoA hydratase echA8 [Rhodococcus sp. T7]
MAAVAGYALGGGCELAMLCDILIAADTAKFGQPEIKLGVIPGIGGSQRLTRAVDMAPRPWDCPDRPQNTEAEEAEAPGWCHGAMPAADLLDEALKTATTTAETSLPVAMVAKKAAWRSFETTLTDGLRFERRVFHSTFCTEDPKRSGGVRREVLARVQAPLIAGAAR